MRKRRLIGLALNLALCGIPVFSVQASAQEGHPLHGSWTGMWENNTAHGENLLVVLEWDGVDLTGMINPGTENIAITNASLDPENWMVRIEARAPATENGEAIQYVIEGEIEQLELANRSIVGTWSHQAGRGSFEIVRQ